MNRSNTTLRSMLGIHSTLAGLALMLSCILGAIPLISKAQSCIKPAYVVTGDSLIMGGCIIDGDLTILNGGALEVDLTGATADTFIVRGNILLEGNGVLWIHGDPGATNDQFIISNSYSEHRNISTRDSSGMMLQDIEFRTQEGLTAGLSAVFMHWITHENSAVVLNNCSLNFSTAWILHDMYDKSRLIVNECVHVPTEVYIYDSTRAEFHGVVTKSGIWMDFRDHTDTLDLPDQSGQFYSWQVGQGLNGVTTGWQVLIDSASVGLAVNIHPTSNMTFNGHGVPATGELTVGMFFDNGVDTLNGLQVGLQNTTLDNRITFNNVQLGPIAWQIYVFMNETLHIQNSIINELGVAGLSQVTVDSSLLQLAVLACIYPGASLTVNNSENWNSLLQASGGGTITLNDCDMYGSEITAFDLASSININNSCFYQNPTGCTPNTMVNIATGQPNCNPFIPPGYPFVNTVGAVQLNNVDSCDIVSVDEIMPTGQSTPLLYPNPANHTLFIDNLKNNHEHYVVVDIAGREVLSGTLQDRSVDVSGLIKGVYLIQFSGSGATMRFLKE